MWFLTVVYGVFHIRNIVCMSPESSVSILKSLASLEVPHLLDISRAFSKESKKTCLVTDHNQLCISPWECILHVTIKLCINFEVPSFLRSPQLLCVLRGSSVVNGVFYVRNLVCLSPGSLLRSTPFQRCLQSVL